MFWGLARHCGVLVAAQVFQVEDSGPVGRQPHVVLEIAPDLLIQRSRPQGSDEIDLNLLVETAHPILQLFSPLKGSSIFRFVGS